MIRVGDTFTCDDGTGLKIETIEPQGLFTAQLRSMVTGEWTQHRLRGEAAKLPLFLKQRGAKKENPDQPSKEVVR